METAEEQSLLADLTDALSDFTLINNTKRLRGCLLYCARLHRRHNQAALADEIERSVRNMPKRMNKETINYILTAACYAFKILP